MDIKTKAQGVNPSIEPCNVSELAGLTGNIYESLNVVAKRSNQIGSDLKRELLGKLEEFASSTENLEEIQENKEQIEISKFYERLPNPVILAKKEFEEGEVHHRYSKKVDEITYNSRRFI